MTKYFWHITLGLRRAIFFRIFIGVGVVALDFSFVLGSKRFVDLAGWERVTG